MDAIDHSPPSTPRLPFTQQLSDLHRRQSVSDLLSPSRSYSDAEGESCTTIESDLHLVQDTMKTPDSEPTGPDREASTVDLNRMMTDSIEETSAPIGLGLVLDPVDTDENTTAAGWSKGCFEKTKSDSEPSDFTNKTGITIKSDSEPAEAAVDNMSSPIESKSMLQSATKKAITVPSRIYTVETVLPSIEPESESTKAETGHEQDYHALGLFATSLKDLQNCVEEWAWTRDQVVPRLPDEAVRDQLLKMTRAAHSALQSVSEVDVRQGHDEQDVEKGGCRSRSDMIIDLHAQLSRVFSTYDAYLSRWSADNHEKEVSRPTRAATVDQDDEEMLFATEMGQKNRDLQTENERLKTKVLSLEWCNHNLRQSDEASKEKLESLTRETASCEKVEHDLKEEVKASWLAVADSLRPDQVEWRAPDPEDSLSTASSQRIDWRQKFWSEQTRAIEAERSKQDCEKELEDVRWEVKGLERDLKASHAKEKQLEQRLKQRQTQEVEDNEMIPWDPEPQTLYSELGSLINSPRQTFEPIMSNNHEPTTMGRPAGSPAQIASVLAREEYTAWTDVFLLISFLFQRLGWLLTCFIFQGLLCLPLLRRIPGKDWQPTAKPERSFQTDGLVRALRQVMLFLSLHAYLSCRAERHVWLSANRQTKFYLRRELAYGRPWWIVPGVDPTILLLEVNELMAPIIAQTMDVWLPVVVNWWRGELQKYIHK